MSHPKLLLAAVVVGLLAWSRKSKASTGPARDVPTTPAAPLLGSKGLPPGFDPKSPAPLAGDLVDPGWIDSDTNGVLQRFVTNSDAAMAQGAYMEANTGDEAIVFYAWIFPDGKVQSYWANGGKPEGPLSDYRVPEGETGPARDVPTTPAGTLQSKALQDIYSGGSIPIDPYQGGVS